MTPPRPRWGGRKAQRISAEVLARDYDPALGYTPCRWCGTVATTADHWPIARIDGGPDTAEACVASCLPCNVSRGVQLRQDRDRPPTPSRVW